jgi:hypothetical protein
MILWKDDFHIARKKVSLEYRVERARGGEQALGDRSTANSWNVAASSGSLNFISARGARFTLARRTLSFENAEYARRFVVRRVTGTNNGCQ